MASMPPGISVPGVTSEPAATMARTPILAPSSNVEELPTRAHPPTEAACSGQRCPTVAPGPSSTPPAGVTWMTAQSCTLAPLRITIGLKSARRTVLYQTEAFSSTVTSPMRLAVGAMKAVGCTRGDLPSNEKSGIRGSLPTTGCLRGTILRPRSRQGKWAGRGPVKYLLKIDLLCFDRQLGVQPVQTKGGP